MGIKRFTSFIDNIDGVRVKHELRDTRVVIDGLNVMQTLYRQQFEKSNDYLFGGNYSEFARSIRQFFGALKQCDIEPIVIIGSNLDDYDEEKQVKKFEKAVDILTSINSGLKDNNIIDMSNQFLILPLLLKDAFIAVLVSLKIACFVNPFNANTNLVKLSNSLKCPLISDYSNFFAFDVTEGVISFNTMKWRETANKFSTHCIESNVSSNHIECEIYSIDRFVENFKGLKKEMLPIFASIIGNKYNSFKPFEDMLANNNCVDTVCENWKVSDEKSKSQIQFKFIFKVLNWLSQKNKNYVSYQIKAYLNSKCLSVEDYESLLKSYDVSENDSYLLKYIESDGMEISDYAINTVRDETEKSLKNIRYKISHLPIWYLKEFFFTTKLSPLSMHICLGKQLILKPVVEDMYTQSIHKCSQQILEHICAIIRGTQQTDTICVKFRNFCKLRTYIDLKAESITKNSLDLPNFADLRNSEVLDKKKSLLLLIEILDLDKQFVSKLYESTSDFWIFVIIVAKFWKRNSFNKLVSTEHFMNSLLLCVFYEICGEKAVYKMFPKLSTNEFSGQSIELRLIHSFNEFQCCVYFIRLLNSLLDSPLNDGQLVCLLNGKMIHEVYVNLQRNCNVVKESPESYIDSFLLKSIFRNVTKAID